MKPFENWTDGVPPLAWERVLAMDVGGATANVLEWAALDPDTSTLVFYDEVAKITTNMREIAVEALPRMRHPNGDHYQFKFKVGDYENRVALDEMSRHGLKFDNAVKQNKILSVHRLSGYLHPNANRPFPAWHPRAGEFGAPLLFITSACKTLIRELPQQKWKAERSGDSLKDELDRTVRHDSVDCALYITRLLPAPATIPVPKVSATGDNRSIQSKLYWEDVKRLKEKQSSTTARKPYNPAHNGGGHWGSLLALR